MAIGIIGQLASRDDLLHMLVWRGRLGAKPKGCRIKRPQTVPCKDGKHRDAEADCVSAMGEISDPVLERAALQGGKHAGICPASPARRSAPTRSDTMPSPAPPFRISAPSRPTNALVAVLPVRQLFRALPVPLISVPLVKAPVFKVDPPCHVDPCPDCRDGRDDVKIVIEDGTLVMIAARSSAGGVA